MQQAQQRGAAQHAHSTHLQPLRKLGIRFRGVASQVALEQHAIWCEVRGRKSSSMY